MTNMLVRGYFPIVFTNIRRSIIFRERDQIPFRGIWAYDSCFLRDIFVSKHIQFSLNIFRHFILIFSGFIIYMENKLLFFVFGAILLFIFTPRLGHTNINIFWGIQIFGWWSLCQLLQQSKNSIHSSFDCFNNAYCCLDNSSCTFNLQSKLPTSSPVASIEMLF